MRSDANFLLLVFFVVYLLAPGCVAEVATTSETKYAVAPDKHAVISWADGKVDSKGLDFRTILLFDCSTCTLGFHLLTIPRYTGAAWSLDSHACSIFNAPDDSNTWIWLFQKDETGWTGTKFNLLDALAQVLPFQQNSIQRGGLLDIKWTDSKTLLAHVQSGAQIIAIRIIWKQNDINKPVFQLLR